MAAPLPTSKQSVNLAAPGVRVSRIRRDPPPVVKQKPAVDPEERDQRIVIIGVVAFALALAVIIVGISSYVVGWAPSEYNIHIED